MRTFLTHILVAAIFFVSSLLVANGAEAAYFRFDQSTVSVTAGETFTIGVIVDAGTDQIQSADIYVVFDSSSLEAESVTPGSYFPSVLETISAGEVYIAGVPQQQNQPITGSGTAATIQFKALKPATLSFNCESSTIIKYDPNSPNILVCSQNQSATVTVGGSNPTPTGSGNNGNTDTGNNTYSQPTPSVLPQTGFFDNTVRLIIPGLMLLAIGILARAIL